MTMLAQIENAPAESIKNAALIIASVLAAAYYIMEMFMRVRKLIGGDKTEIQQPLEIRHADKFVPKDEFAKHTDWNADEHEKLWRRIDEDRVAASNSATSRSDKLYSRIEAVENKINDHLVEMNKELGALSAETKQQSALLLSIKRDRT
jgi:hypothetical protein